MSGAVTGLSTLSHGEVLFLGRTPLACLMGVVFSGLMKQDDLAKLGFSDIAPKAHTKSGEGGKQL